MKISLCYTYTTNKIYEFNKYEYIIYLYQHNYKYININLFILLYNYDCNYVPTRNIIIQFYRS